MSYVIQANDFQDRYVYSHEGGVVTWREGIGEALQFKRREDAMDRLKDLCAKEGGIGVPFGNHVPLWTVAFVTEPPRPPRKWRYLVVEKEF